MGSGIVQRLKETFDIEERWLGFEIHPETPVDGVPMSERFPSADIEQMYVRLQQMASEYDLEMNAPPVLANSHMAMEAAEVARDQGKFDAMHDYLFRAYFTEGLDIGDLEVIGAGARQADLDEEGLAEAVGARRYEERLQKVTEAAHHYGINSTPTFVINERYGIVGAQPYDTFVKQLRQIQAEDS